MNTYRNVVDDLSNLASVENLDKVVDCVNRSLYRSAKLASTNTPGVSDESVTENVRQTDNEIYELATAMLDDYDESKCTLEEYENVCQQAVQHLISSSSSGVESMSKH